MANWKSDFSETKKIAFFIAPLNRGVSKTEQIAFSWRPEKAIFRKQKKSSFVAPWINDFSETERNRFYWRPKKAFFRKPKKSLLRGYLKNLFFGNRKNRWSWHTETNIFQKPKEIVFSSRPEKAAFRKQKQKTFIWRSGKAIFRKNSPSYDALKKTVSLKPKKSLFPPSLGKEFFGNRKIASWKSDFTKTEKIAFALRTE